MGSSVILPSPGQPTEGPDPSFKTASIPNVVTFGFAGIDPPAALYVQRDDTLIISAVSSIATETVQFAWRILLPVAPQAGQPDAPSSGSPLASGPGGNNIVMDAVDVPVTGARVQSFKVIQGLEGYLIGMTASAVLATTRGQTYARVIIRRNNQLGIAAEAALFADYVTTAFQALYPNGRFIHYVEGPGFIHSQQVANPAAGTDFTLTVPANTRWRIKSFDATLTTSAAVANRNVQIAIDDGANSVWAHDVAATIAASTSNTIVGTGTNAPTGVVTTIQSVVIPPDLIIPAGFRIRSATINLQAADQWSSIFFLVEEWIDF